jgi:hypothetical protein
VLDKSRVLVYNEYIKREENKTMKKIDWMAVLDWTMMAVLPALVIIVGIATIVIYLISIA